MSYCFLIATANTPWLLKSRQQNFTLIDPKEDLFFYARTDEAQTWVHRENQYYTLKASGIAFFSQLSSPIFFMYFLLGNRQSEMGVVEMMHQNIRLQNFETVTAFLGDLKLNQIYLVKNGH